jgi:glycosyltransferase involved in cell wall biosynthesis
MEKRVSVCIPTYNGAKYIREQLDSILSQLGESDEIVVSDDSSHDDTLAIVRSIGDNRIVVLEGGDFKSPIFNVENALKHSKGRFIFLSDQDDVWMDGKLSAMLSELEKYDAVVSDCKVVDQNKNVIEESFSAKRNSGKGFLKNLYKNTYLGCCMAFRREVLDYVLPFPKDIPMHDMWIGLSVDFRKPVGFINTPYLLYRRHGGNTSTASGKSNRSVYRQLLDRITLLFRVLQRI